MPPTIKFGTDGWRAIIAQDFTFDNVRACAQGVADYLGRARLAEKGLVIGYDTRFASEDFAAACAEVVAGNGIRAYLCPHPTPTPVVSFGVLAKKAAGAIIITASHNPHQWSGFKLKTHDGASAPEPVTQELEENIARIQQGGEVRHLPLAQARSQGLVQDYDVDSEYLPHLGRLVDLPRLRQAGLKIIADAMYGAGAGYFPKLLGGGSTQLEEIHGERNPLFPGLHPEPILPHLSPLASLIKEKRASVGLATDGDADRMGIIDEKGEFLTQHQVFALLAFYLLEVRKQRGPIIRTITSTSMLDLLGKRYGVPVQEVAVGFKYVAPLMLAQNALLGGEESGGYGFRGHIPERDGILGGLFFLDLMVSTGQSPSRLLERLYGLVGPHHYRRLDMAFPPEERQEVMRRVGGQNPKYLVGKAVVGLDRIDGFRFHLADSSWLLIRPSGTEPLVRLYAEAPSLSEVDALLEEGKKLAGL